MNVLIPTAFKSNAIEFKSDFGEFHSLYSPGATTITHVIGLGAVTDVNMGWMRSVGSWYRTRMLALQHPINVVQGTFKLSPPTLRI